MIFWKAAAPLCWRPRKRHRKKFFRQPHPNNGRCVGAVGIGVVVAVAVPQSLIAMEEM
jgi:hypothetical protein